MSKEPRMHHFRRAWLDRLKIEPVAAKPVSDVKKWALRSGYVEERDGLLHITSAGDAALADAKIDPDKKLALELLPKLRGKTLCRQTSGIPEARSDGFVYFTEPDHKVFPTVCARILIDEGYLTPHEDGLFAGISQTFEVNDAR